MGCLVACTWMSHEVLICTHSGALLVEDLMLQVSSTFSSIHFPLPGITVWAVIRIGLATYWESQPKALCRLGSRVQGQPPTLNCGKSLESFLSLGSTVSRPSLGRETPKRLMRRRAGAFSRGACSTVAPTFRLKRLRSVHTYHLRGTFRSPHFPKTGPVRFASLAAHAVRSRPEGDWNTRSGAAAAVDDPELQGTLQPNVACRGHRSLPLTKVLVKVR